MSFVSHREEALNQLKQALRSALGQCGDKAESYAKDLCPVDSGNLRDSITHAVPDDTTMALGTDVDYAVFVELGSPPTAPRPFLRPALEDHADEWQETIRNALEGK